VLDLEDYLNLKPRFEKDDACQIDFSGSELTEGEMFGKCLI
jgi:hypothetical protein